MSLRILLLCIVMLPTLATAEIYKWKDKDGVVRYSDIPPPSDVKQENLYGKKTPKPTSLAPLAPVESNITTAIKRDNASLVEKGNAKASGKTKEDKVVPNKEDAALKRAKDAEQQKNRTFTVQISKTDENGNKVYLGDADISQG